MTKPEPTPQKWTWRTRLNRTGAALTHALFALTIALTFVRSDAPQAEQTALLAEREAAAQQAPGEAQPAARIEQDASETRTAERDEASSPIAQQPEDERVRIAAADPQPLPARLEGDEPDAAPAEDEQAEAGAEELILAQGRRKKREEDEDRAETAPPASPPSAEQIARFKPLLDRLVAAYPEFLSAHDGTHLIWKDGTRMVFDDGKEKTIAERLKDADLEDQFLFAYSSGPMLDDPPRDFDPGRIRSEAFFRKMYGNCRTGEVEKKLAPVTWLPKNGGKTIKVTSVNGIAEKLQQVSAELDTLVPDLLKFLQPVASTFTCRDISRTGRSSAHVYGIAVDLNADYGDYWQSGKPRRGGVYAYRNRIPWEIVQIFEKHGFIWGGKWYHFDTLHFEYRPELIAIAEEAAAPSSEPAPMPEKQPRNLN